MRNGNGGSSDKNNSNKLSNCVNESHICWRSKQTRGKWMPAIDWFRTVYSTVLYKWISNKGIHVFFSTIKFDTRQYVNSALIVQNWGVMKFPSLLSMIRISDNMLRTRSNKEIQSEINITAALSLWTKLYRSKLSKYKHIFSNLRQKNMPDSNLRSKMS